jgi:uncharacterized Zn finger protein
MATSSPEEPSTARHCPKCNVAQVRAVSQTEYFVDFRCSSCGAVWSEPERRKGKRVSGKESAAGIEIALAPSVEYS